MTNKQNKIFHPRKKSVRHTGRLISRLLATSESVQYPVMCKKINSPNKKENGLISISLVLATFSKFQNGQHVNVIAYL